MKKSILVFLYILISFFGNSQTSNEETSALLDSLNKYKFIDSYKAFDYGLQALETTSQLESAKDNFNYMASLKI